MGKNGLSATEIGDVIGLSNARVTNKLLAIVGVHEKVDYGWKLTEFGERFANVVNDDTGYGGSAFKQWSKTYFAPEMLDELTITPELIQQATTEYAADLAAAALKKAASQAEAEELFRQGQKKIAQELQGMEVDWKKVAWLVGGAIVVTGTTIAVVKYGPAIKQRTLDAVGPRVDAVKKRLSRSRGDGIIVS